MKIVHCNLKEKRIQSQVQWLMPIIPAIQEAAIGRIAVQGQPSQKVSESPS
jgi:hypothetical protein